MERCGINLTNAKQLTWEKDVKKQLGMLLFNLILCTLITSYFVIEILQTSEKNRPLMAQKHIISQEIFHLEKKIEKYKTNIIHSKDENYLSAQKLSSALTLIQQIPLPNGGVNQIKINQQDSLIIKILGTLENQSQIDTLEDFLIKKSISNYNIENLYTNDRKEIEFSISIKYE